MNGPDDPATRKTATPQSRDWFGALHSIWQELPGLVGDRLELLGLEVRRAGRALAQIVALLVAAAVLAVTAWLVAWAGVAVGLVQIGMHWAAALLLVLVANLAAAGLALGRLRRLLPLLRLPATRRHLTPAARVPPAPPVATPPAAAPAPLPPLSETG